MSSPSVAHADLVAALQTAHRRVQHYEHSELATLLASATARAPSPANDPSTHDWTQYDDGTATPAPQLAALLANITQLIVVSFIDANYVLAHHASAGLIRVLAPLLRLRPQLIRTYPAPVLAACLPSVRRDVMPLLMRALATPHRFISQTWALYSVVVSTYAGSDTRYRDAMASATPIYDAASLVAHTLETRHEIPIRDIEARLREARGLPPCNEIPDDPSNLIKPKDSETNSDSEDESDSDTDDQSFLPVSLRNIVGHSDTKPNFVDNETSIAYRAQLLYLYGTYCVELQTFAGFSSIPSSTSGRKLDATSKRNTRLRRLRLTLHRSALACVNSSTAWERFIAILFVENEDKHYIQSLLFQKALQWCHVPLPNPNSHAALTYWATDCTVTLYRHVFLLLAYESDSFESFTSKADAALHHALIAVFSNNTQQTNGEEIAEEDDDDDTTLFKISLDVEKKKLRPVFQDTSSVLYPYIKEFTIQLFEYYSDAISAGFKVFANVSYQRVLEVIDSHVYSRYIAFFGESGRDTYLRPERMLIDRVNVNSSILPTDFVRKNVFDKLIKGSGRSIPELWSAFARYEKDNGDPTRVLGVLRSAINSVGYPDPSLRKALIIETLRPVEPLVADKALNDFHSIDDLTLRYFPYMMASSNSTSDVTTKQADGSATEDIQLGNPSKRKRNDKSDDEDYKTNAEIPIDASIPIPEEENFVTLPYATAGHCILVKGIPIDETNKVLLYETFSKVGCILDFHLRDSNSNDPEYLIEFDSFSSIHSIISERRSHPVTSFCIGGKRLEIQRCRPQLSVWHFSANREDTKIFVRNLPVPSINFTKQNLREEFSKFGEIKDIRLILQHPRKNDENSKEPAKRSFAYIEFTESKFATEALSLNGSTPMWASNGPISVVISDPQHKTALSETSKKDDGDDSNEVYITNLPFHLLESDIKLLLGTHAEKIVDIRLMKTNTKGTETSMLSKGNCFIDFDSAESAELAIKILNGMDVDGRTITAQHPQPRANNKKELRKQKRQLRAKRRLDRSTTDSNRGNSPDRNSHSDSNMEVDNPISLEHKSTSPKVSKAALLMVPRSTALKGRGRK